MLIRKFIPVLVCVFFTGCIMFISTSDFKNFSGKEKTEIQENKSDKDKSGSADVDDKPVVLEVGRVASLSTGSGEVLVNQTKPVKMGETVYVMVRDRKVYMKVTYPMQTVFKCKVTGDSKKYMKDIKKDMIVFRDK